MDRRTKHLLRQAEYRNANREKCMAATAAWTAKNQDHVKSYRAAYYKENKEKILARQNEVYWANPQKKKTYGAAWYKANKEKRTKSIKAWQDKNKEKHKALVRRWAFENPERHKELRASFRLKHKETLNADSAAYRQKFPDKVRAIKAAYRKENPGAGAADAAKRRATLLRSAPKWANKFFISEAYHLAKLREQVCGGKWHVDHVVPLTSKFVCGLHVHNNLRVIPGRENLSKGNRHWPDMPEHAIRNSNG